jgi:hypothetical protein
VSAVLAPTLFALLYFVGGTVAAFQRDYIAILPIATALALLSRTPEKPPQTAALIGALCGMACGFKPNFIVVAPALFWILLLDMPGKFPDKLKQTLLPAAGGFIAIFSIPFIWGIKHADFHELIVLYKSYTPIYVSTRTDLYHYDSRKQQLLDLASMQVGHLLKMGMLSIPGLLWAWRQQRHNPAALKILRNLAILTFAIAWHELIAGKYWLAHLLPPYFFVILCFSLVLTPIASTGKPAENVVRALASIGLMWIIFQVGMYADKNLYA